MKSNEKLIVVLALGGAAWYLYTRQQGLTLTGQPAHPMLPPGYDPSLSPVRPSGSTNTAATNTANIAASISSLANSVISIFAKRPAGNAAVRPSSSFAIPPGNVGQPAANPGVPAIGSELPIGDPSLDESMPYWQWDFSFDVPPVVPNLEALAWTVTPDMNYIPPPPGK